MCDLFTVDNIYIVVAMASMLFLIWAQHHIISTLQQNATETLRFQQDVLIQNCALAEKLSKATLRVKELEKECEAQQST